MDGNVSSIAIVGNREKLDLVDTLDKAIERPEKSGKMTEGSIAVLFDL